MTSTARALAAALLAGTALLGAGALFHPVLAGSAEAQLQLIASTTIWRPLHLAMLAGSGLVVIGVFARVSLTRSGSAAPMLAALGVIAIGTVLNALNIAYMAGSGWHMAAMFAQGQREMAPLFEATHPIGLMFARFGNLVVALGAAWLGALERADPESPRWVSGLAWLAACGGLAGVLLFPESSRAALAAVALLSAWEVATAVRVLNPRSALSA